MDKKEEYFNIESRLTGLKLLKFQLVPNISELKFDVSKISYQNMFSLEIKKETKSIVFFFNCVLFNEDNSTILGEINTSGEFLLPNMEDVVARFNGVPFDMLSLLAGVLIGSTRGFLVLKAEGTPIEGALLPMIDPKIFFRPQAIQSSK